MLAATIRRPRRAGQRPPEPAPAEVAAREVETSATAWYRGSETRCEQPVPVFADGRQVGVVCPDAAAAVGLTVIDLSDDWVPQLFRAPALDGSPNPYRDMYVALANEKFGNGRQFDRPKRDVFLELYGISPSLAVVARRLGDQERHACHAQVDSAPLTAVKRANIDLFLPPQSPAERAANATLDARMVCERLLPPLPPKVKSRARWKLQHALAAYQRKHTIVSRGMLDLETRRALAEPSRELDFRALLRALRTRVVDATGIIEDGTARGERGTVLGRRIEGDDYYAAEYQPIPDGAIDHVSAATESAARALGWIDIDSAAAAMASWSGDGSRSFRVAVELPPAPAYHTAHMEIRAEIDRGKRAKGKSQRPTLTVFAQKPDGTEIALLRWHTTIGGWKKELLESGDIAMRFKASDLGPRVWRDLVALPSWLPPPTTPPRTLVRKVREGRWVADTELTGPGYASAYGLVMLVHHMRVERKGKVTWYDNGIRTHGSVSYDSILSGTSHGCHRLFNQSALQLSSFLLRHRRHVAHGLDARPFVRMLSWEGRTVRLPIPHRGYRYELLPPVAVEVFDGPKKPVKVARK